MKRSNQEIVQSLKRIASQKFTWFALLMVSLTFTAFNTRPEATPRPFNISEGNDISAPAKLADTPELTEAVGISHAAELLPEVENLSNAYLQEMEHAYTTTTEAIIEDLTEDIIIPEPKAVAAPADLTSLTAYAQSLLGRPYNYGGTTPAGFDCSGFVYHVFHKFDKKIERTSRSQSTQGKEIKVENALPGDLIFFTGTNPKVREVGHVGIIISTPGEPLSFVHSSSNGGVKISQLEGYYNTRFMFAKRMD